MSYPKGEYIVETGWLEENLEDPDLRILDCGVDYRLTEEGRFEFTPARETWESGHIPGASFVDFARDVSDQTSRLPFMLPPPDAFGETMARHGLGGGTRVVIYDKVCNNWAARLWWTLRAYGLTNAAVLNGGLVKWKLEGRPLTTEDVVPPPGDFEPRPDQQVFVGRERVLAAIEERETRLVDALEPDHYAGTNPVGVARPGHISSAGNLPWIDVVDMETHAYLPPEDLGPVLERSGLATDDRVITYCTAGIASSSVAFAMALMGYDHVSVYDGSLLEWAADPALPMEVPARR